MTQDEQWEAVSALKNLVQALGPDADVFDNIHTSTIVRWRSSSVEIRRADSKTDSALHWNTAGRTGSLSDAAGNVRHL